MLTTREVLYQALFSQLSTAIGFNSYWRKFVPIAQLMSPQLPALMMREVKEEIHEGYGLPPKYTIDVDVGILCETLADLSDVIPAQVINPLIDAVERSLAPPPNAESVLTLDIDSVSRVWIEGSVEILETIPGSSDRTFALIPIKIVCQ